VREEGAQAGPRDEGGLTARHGSVGRFLGGPAGGPPPGTSPKWVGEWLRRRAAGSTVARPTVRVVQIGAKQNLRLVTIVVAALLATAAPAGGQEPASPDAASSTSHAPRPDPAPVKAKPKPKVARPAPRPATAAATTTTTTTTTTISPPAPVVTAPTQVASKPVQRTATPRHKKPARRQHRAAPPKRRTQVVALSLPRLTLAHLTAPPTNADAGRARKLAAGALSLLVLALASATLLAFMARVERRREAR
jgi:hypothetical protein